MRPRGIVLALAIGGLVVTQGCAAIGLSLLSSAASTAAGSGVAHTLHGIAYKTFTVPLEGLHKATLITLKRMKFAVTESGKREGGLRTVATAEGLGIVIDLDELTSRTTRMRVTVKKNWLIHDPATAREIILQTDQSLLDNPQLAAIKSRVRKQAAPSGQAKRPHRHHPH